MSAFEHLVEKAEKPPTFLEGANVSWGAIAGEAAPEANLSGRHCRP